MDRFKRILRYIRLSLTIILIVGSVGLGGIAPLFSNKRERYMDKVITIEQVDKKEEESDIEYHDTIE